PNDATFYVIGNDRIRLSTAPRIVDSSKMLMVEPLQGGELLLAMGDRPLLWMVTSPPVGLPEILSTAARGVREARLRNACFRALARADNVAAAVLRETQVLVPARARRLDDPASPINATLEAILPDGEGGLFLRGWLRDPMHLVAGVEVRTPFGARSVDPAQLHGIRRPDLVRHFAKTKFRDRQPAHGFVAHVPDPSNGLTPQPGLILRLRSGNVIEVATVAHHLPPAQARDAVLSSVPPDQATAIIVDQCLAPAAAALHRGTLVANRIVDCVHIGKPPRQPAVSIVVPLYRNLSFLRFQTAAFARDRGCREAELIYVLDSPDQRTELHSLLRGLNALHGLAFTMAVMPENLGYAAANNAAATIARGRELLLLNSDVVPARTGWLASLRTALTLSGVDAAGPKLLFDDGSIQHGGLYFKRDGEGIWYNAHYHKGMPRQWRAALSRRKVPGVTGAALLVRRKTFEAVGGICEDYIIGDYEDSDFCLRLRDTGSAIAYVPDAELYHFERRSIHLHPGYTGTLASLYNRRLHHRRWDSTMTALMAQRAFRVLA
ncbi:MAG TPA: glycosyltransferase, partial [Rhodopila sp.]